MKLHTLLFTLVMIFTIAPLSIVTAEEKRTAGTQATSKESAKVEAEAEPEEKEAKEKTEEKEEEPKKEESKKEEPKEKASKEAAKSAEPKVYDVDISDIESLGLYTSQSDGGFGRDLWSESSRENIIPLIKNLPEDSDSYFINSMIMGILLSKANADLIEGSTHKPGEDLLTLRLKKLIALGAYEQAFELYSLLDEAPYHYELAKTGVTAMLLSGNKSLACVDIKTATKRFEDTALFKGLAAYCDLAGEENDEKKSETLATLKASSTDILKKIGRTPKYEQNYNPHLLDKLSPLELGLLVADNRLKFHSIETIGLSKIPKKHLSLVLASDSLSERQRIALTAKALRFGLVRPDTLKKLYETVDIPAEPSGWIRMAANYQKAKDAKDKARLAQVEAAYKLMNTYGRTAFIPFASLIEPSKTATQLYKNLLVLNAANQSVKEWKGVFDDIPKGKSKSERKEYLSSALAIYTSIPKSQLKQADKDFWAPHISNALNVKRPLVDPNFYSAMQKNTKNTGYGKIFPLTSPKDYVMPSVRLWDRLRNASDRGAISEVILLSTYILQNLEPSGSSNLTIGNIYPGLIRDIIRSLDEVGLKNTSRDLAVLAALEHIK